MASFSLSSRTIMALVLTAAPIICQPPPPPPPPPPEFMTMRGPDLACFNMPRVEEDGVELFVCNGGGGMAGFRKKNDPSHTIFVQDTNIAMNLSMKIARASCVNGRFAVSADAGGFVSFSCNDREIKTDERFRAASKAEWEKYRSILYR